MSYDAQERLREARSRLWTTLSGREVPKQNAAPDTGYRDFAEVVKQNAAAQAKLNASKKELVETLSHGLKSDGFDDGVEVVEVPQAQQQRLIAARREMRLRLAGIPIKQNACPYAADGSTGKKITTDSPITPSGTPFSGGWEITERQGRVTLATIAAEQDADANSPSPAVVSGQTAGQSDWSPDTANGDYDANPQLWDADQAKADILSHYRNKNRDISGYAKKWFLNVLSDASKPEHFILPLGQINASQQPYYDSRALLEAWKHASGDFNSAVNRSLQLRLVRIMRRAGFTLTPQMQEFATKYMGEAKDEDEGEEEGNL